MSKKNQLSDIHNSGKSYIIYKSKKGFDLYTNFSKKIILNNSNISKFLSKKHNNILHKNKHRVQQIEFPVDFLLALRTSP